jgi:HEAT repeat protein
MASASFITGVKAWAAAEDPADVTAQIDTIRRVGRYEAVARGIEIGERDVPGARQAAIRLLAAAAMANRTRAREAVRTSNCSSAWRVELNNLFIAMRQADPMLFKARDRAMRTRLNAIRALVNDRDNGRLHFYMLMADRDATVRREALNHAGAVLGAVDAMRTLIETLTYDPDWQVREHAYEAIRELDPLPGDTVRDVARSQPPRLAMLLTVLAHSLDPDATFTTRTERIASLRAFQHEMTRRFGSSRYGSNARRSLAKQIEALRTDSRVARDAWGKWWERNRRAFQGEPPTTGHAPVYADGFGP